MKYLLFAFLLFAPFTIRIAHAETYIIKDGKWVDDPTSYVLKNGQWTPQNSLKTDPLFERIAWCESRNNLGAKNPNSTATGEFQWIKSSWAYYGRELWGSDFYDKKIKSLDNRELAWYVYNKYGTDDWLASKPCWRGYIKYATI